MCIQQKMEKAIDDVKNMQWQKYTDNFNFFQSKYLTLILTNRKVQHTIHYKDLQFFDDEVEYLKRYYHEGQSQIRVQKLIKSKDYYENNMTPPQSNLIPIQSYPILENRHAKLIKLQIMKEKSIARRKQKEKEGIQSSLGQECLPELENSKFSDVESSKQSSSSYSYDSSLHDIFSDEEEEKDEILRHNQEFISTKDMRESYLVIDFKKVIKPVIDEERKQTEEIKKIKSKQREKEKKKKTESFMEYYNSVSKKSSSNILEKYIKTKR